MGDRMRKRARPSLEGLEDRRLLSGSVVESALPLSHSKNPTNEQEVAKIIFRLSDIVPLSDRRIFYQTPEGTQVVLTLFGAGTLKGTHVLPDGTLELLYDGTNSSSQIVGRTFGGTGRAPVRIIRDADTPVGEISGIGANLVGGVKLPRFDLVEDGYINLAGGIGLLRLATIGPNTEIELRQLPAPEGTFNPSFAFQENVQFVSTAGGGQEVAGVGGLQVPGAARVGTTGQAQPERAPGVGIIIDEVLGAPLGTPPLKPAQIFGYDPTANALIRFDVATGDVLQTIPLPGAGNPVAGVGLGRDAAGHQVVLVGIGSTVRAFDVVTGDSVGTFTTANLPGLDAISGIAWTGSRSILTDASADMTGVARAIDVAASLARGEAVPLGMPFSPKREFFLSGGATGTAGTSVAFATGAAHFDTFQPNEFQTGVLSMNTRLNQIVESSRQQLTFPPGIVDAGPPLGPPDQALGGVDRDIALVTGVDAKNGTNIVQLYDPNTFAPAGQITLKDPNQLTGLSETFHPELRGAAVINVRGVVQSLRVQKARGLVLNDIGFLNLLNVNDAVDSTFIGLPVGHVQIGRRQNVQILSTPRTVGSQNFVTIVPNLQPVGPLTTP